jgi:hypothetical protein
VDQQRGHLPFKPPAVPQSSRRFSAMNALALNLRGAISEEFGYSARQAKQIVELAAEALCAHWYELCHGHLWIVSLPEKKAKSWHVTVTVMNTDEMLEFIKHMRDSGVERTFHPLNATRVLRELQERAEKKHVLLPPTDNLNAWCEVIY